MSQSNTYYWNNHGQNCIEAIVMAFTNSFNRIFILWDMQLQLNCTYLLTTLLPTLNWLQSIFFLFLSSLEYLTNSHGTTTKCVDLLFNDNLARSWDFHNATTFPGKDKRFMHDQFFFISFKFKFLLFWILLNLHEKHPIGDNTPKSCIGCLFYNRAWIEYQLSGFLSRTVKCLSKATGLPCWSLTSIGKW